MWDHKKMVNFSSQQIQQLCWSYLQWWSPETWSQSWGFRSCLGLQGYSLKSQAYFVLRPWIL